MVLNVSWIVKLNEAQSDSLMWPSSYYSILNWDGLYTDISRIQSHLGLCLDFNISFENQLSWNLGLSQKTIFHPQLSELIQPPSLQGGMSGNQKLDFWVATWTLIPSVSTFKSQECIMAFCGSCNFKLFFKHNECNSLPGFTRLTIGLKCYNYLEVNKAATQDSHKIQWVCILPLPVRSKQSWLNMAQRQLNSA